MIVLYFISESGYFVRNLGCPSLQDLDSLVAASRHQCAILCLANEQCETFTYHYDLSEPLCMLHTDTCKPTSVANIHMYDKGRYNKIGLVTFLIILPIISVKLVKLKYVV